MVARSFSTSVSRALNLSRLSRTGVISCSVALSRTSAWALAVWPCLSSVSVDSTLNWLIIDSRSAAISLARSRAASRWATALATSAETSAAFACAAAASAAGLGHVAAGLGRFCSCLRGFRACRRRVTVRLRDQHLRMCRVGLLAGTRDRPAGDAPEQESDHQATDQRNDRDTIHGGDLAWAETTKPRRRLREPPHRCIDRRLAGCDLGWNHVVRA